MNTLRLLTAGLAAAFTLTACITDADKGVVPGRAPEKHRPVAEMCDDARDSSGPFIDDWALEQGDYVSCTAHEECTEGDNGRCIGNGHDGWSCSYDRCFADDDCDNVCECEGGFRGDFNVCVGGDCRTDADCGPGGYCSPSFGDCGEYTGVVAYYCHTPDDECIDDSDCDGDGNFGAPYCAYNPAAGKWMCSDSHCAG